MKPLDPYRLANPREEKDNGITYTVTYSMKDFYKLKELKRHEEILHLCDSEKIPIYRDPCGIDYKKFVYEGQDVIYFLGSNEPDDWGWNSLFFGIRYHFGFFLKSKIAEKHFDIHDNCIIVVHSHGSFGLIPKWKNVAETIGTGVPPLWTLFNFRRLKNTTIYELKKDIVAKAYIVALWLKRPKKPVMLDYDGDGIAGNHTHDNYVLALRKLIDKLEG